MPSPHKPPLSAWLRDGLLSMPMWKRLLALAGAITSLAFTHYAGFLANLPPVFRDFIAERYAPSFLSTFVVTAAFAFVLARLGAFLAVPVFKAIALAAVRVLSWRGVRFARRGIRTVRFIDSVGPLSLTLLLGLLILWVMYAPVARLDHLAYLFGVPLAGGVLLTSVTVAMLLKPNASSLRTGSRKEVLRRPQVLLALAWSTVAGLSLCAFVLGSARFDVLVARKAIAVASPCFHGKVHLLLSAGNEMLVMTRTEADTQLFVATGPTYAVASDGVAVGTCK